MTKDPREEFRIRKGSPGLMFKGFKPWSLGYVNELVIGQDIKMQSYGGGHKAALRVTQKQRAGARRKVYSSEDPLPSTRASLVDVHHSAVAYQVMNSSIGGLIDEVAILWLSHFPKSSSLNLPWGQSFQPTRLWRHFWFKSCQQMIWVLGTATRIMLYLHHIHSWLLSECSASSDGKQPSCFKQTLQVAYTADFTSLSPPVWPPSFPCGAGIWTVGFSHASTHLHS